MGIFNRFKQMIRSNINAGLDKVENPDNIMNQSVSDLGNAISEMNSNLISVTSTRLGLEKSIINLKKQAEYWDARCSHSDDVDATRDLSALNNRNKVLTDISKYNVQIKELIEEEDTLKKEIYDSKLELTNLKNKKALLSAKYRVSKNAIKRDKIKDKYDQQGITQTLDRMEEKIENSSNEVKARRLINSSDIDLSYATLDYDNLMKEIKAEK